MSNDSKDKSSTTQVSTKQDHWVWNIAQKPSQSSDGFAHLASAIEIMRNGQEQESVNENIIEDIIKATDCKFFEGRPNRLRQFGEMYSDRLVSDKTEVLFKDLILLDRYLIGKCTSLLAEERFEDASALAESMLALGWLVVANGEDNVLAMWRLATWSEALKIINTIAVRRGDTDMLQELKDAEASMQIEFEKIRQRPSGPLYFPAKK